MTTKTLTGAYYAGYTLNAAYDTLSITSTGTIRGHYFDTGLELTAIGTVINSGRVTGGYIGGSGMDLSAGGAVYNSGVVVGGVGSTRGVGGSAIVLAAAGKVENTGVIKGGRTVTYYTAYAQAAGVVLSAGGTVANSGYIGGGGYDHGDHWLNGSGVVLSAGGTILNGSSSSHAGYIRGRIGIQANSAATVINYGTITGTGGEYIGFVTNAIEFGSSSDRLIDEAGSTINGFVLGGGGTLEMAAGAGTISGLGSAFTGFGSYVVDAGGSWVLTGANTLAAGATLTNSGTLNLGGTLAAAGTIDGGLTLTNSGARLIANDGASFDSPVTGGGGVLELGSAIGTITNLGGGGGGVSGAVTISTQGFGAYQFDAGGTWTLAGAKSLTAGVTLTNFATILGGLTLTSTTNRLEIGAGSTISGPVKGGGGVLEFVSGAAKMTGMGATGTVSGGEAMTFTGFGFYQIDAGAAVTLSGVSNLRPGRTLTNRGTLILAGALQGGARLDTAGGRLIADSGSSATGSVSGGGGVLELASGSGAITSTGSSAKISGAVSMMVSGFASYQLDAGSAWSLAGALGTSQTVSVDGSLTFIGKASNAGRVIDSGTVVVQGSLSNLGSIVAGYSETALTIAAGGHVNSGGVIIGGHGSVGVNNATGGSGVVLTGSGVATNTGGIFGGMGSYNVVYQYYTHYIDSGGAGGVGVADFGGGAVNNTGSIVGGAGGFAIGDIGYLDHVISGGEGGSGVEMTLGGSLANTGAISGGFGGGNYSYNYPYKNDYSGGKGGSGVAMAVGGTVSNSGSIMGGSGGYAFNDGGNGGAGIVMSSGGVVSNSGAIAGGAGGVSWLEQNGAAGTGIIMSAGGLVINGSKTSATASISGLVGVYAGPTGAATVTNFGTIQGLGGTAVQFMSTQDRLVTETGSTWIGAVVGGGGTLELGTGTGTITGLGGAGILSGAEAMTFSGFGSYQLDAGGAWTLAGINTVAGGGALLDLAAVMQTGDLTLGDATAVAVSLTIVKGATWTVSGASTIMGGTGAISSITDRGALIASAGAGSSVIGVKIGTETSGLIEAAGGSLVLQKLITGTGSLQIDAGAVLEVDAGVGSGVTATFNGAGATLKIGNSKAFKATLSGFAVSDTVDLSKLTATAASVNGSDQLVIVNGATTVATLQLTGAYSGATFTVGSDGHGGTNVTLLTAARSPHSFVAAMAGLSAGAGGSEMAALTAAASGSGSPMRLASPSAH